MGTFEDELPTDDSRKKTLILSRGALHEMPDGVMMFAPTKFWPFVTTGLFSWPGKIRMGMDLVRPEEEGRRRTSATTRRSITSSAAAWDVSASSNLAEPLVGGVHASDPKKMSLAATFPNLLDMEQEHGSMLKGFLAMRRRSMRCARSTRRSQGQSRARSSPRSTPACSR